MNYTLALMQTKDERIATAHKDVNSDKDNYAAYQLSTYMPVEFMLNVISRQMAAAEIIFNDYCGKKLDKLFQLYVTWYHDEKWTAFAVRLAHGQVGLQRGGLYFDPTCTGKCSFSYYSYYSYSSPYSSS